MGESMKDRIALAIMKASHCGWTLGDEQERIFCDDPRARTVLGDCECRASADAVLAEMRNADDEMLVAGVYTDVFQGVCEDREAKRAVRNIWQAMIDAANA